MTKLLIRLFVKNREDTTNTVVRRAYGQVASVIGIVCNVLLFAAKLFIGIISSSVSVTADAFNNLSDSASCVVTMLGFKLASKPADREHPFGHGRIEYMSGFIVAVAVVLVGFEVLKSSIDKIINPSSVSISTVTVTVLLISIIVKLWLGFFNRKIGIIIDSFSMRAAATDCLSDVISTGSVLISMIISHLSEINLDGYIGLLVSGIIMFSGIGIIRDTLDLLLGRPPEKTFINEVCSRVLKNELIVGVHDIIAHDYGPGRCYVSLHAEVPSNCDINVIHEIIDDCERDISRDMNIDIVIHMDPIETDNEAVEMTKHKVVEVLQSIDDRLTMHDFRMVIGEDHTNLIFDVVIAREMTVSPDELKREISLRVSQIDCKYRCIINVDFDYTGK